MISKSTYRLASRSSAEDLFLFETIAFLYCTTVTGQAVTTVMDATQFSERTLFCAYRRAGGSISEKLTRTLVWSYGGPLCEKRKVGKCLCGLRLHPERGFEFGVVRQQEHYGHL